MTNPSNIYTFNSLLADLTSKDQYPTDEMYAAILNFTSKDPPIEHMETLGYEGGNFVTMTGSLIINILVPILTY